MGRLLGETIGKIATLLGYDGSGFRPVLLDSDGHIVIALPTYELTSYDSTWRRAAEAAGSSGTIAVNLPAVAADSVLVLENIVCYLSTGSAALMYIEQRNTLNAYTIATLVTPAVNESLRVSSWLTQHAAEYIRAIAVGVGADTRLKIFAQGHYTKA